MAIDQVSTGIGTALRNAPIEARKERTRSALSDGLIRNETKDSPGNPVLETEKKKQGAINCDRETRKMSTGLEPKDRMKDYGTTFKSDGARARKLTISRESPLLPMTPG